MALFVIIDGVVATPASTDSSAPGVKNSWGSISGVSVSPGPVVWGCVDACSAVIASAIVMVVDLGTSWLAVSSFASVSMTWCSKIGCGIYSSTSSPGVFFAVSTYSCRPGLFLPGD